MIKITNLNKSFGERVLFSDVNVTLEAKEKIGLIGRNGSGKSTFMNLLKERDDHDGSIYIPENLIISALEQNLNFKHENLLKQACSALPPQEFGQEWKAESILMGLGFSREDFQKDPKSFSSGFQIRIRLAEALIKEPHLLLLDEPTNYLDILTLRWLSRFLKNWKNSFMLVTHDRHFMEEVVNYTIAIHRGKMRKMKGGPKKLMDQIKQDEEVYEKTRQKQLKKKEQTEVFISKFRAKARSAGLVQSRIKAIEKMDIGDQLEKIPEISFRFHALPFQGDSLLKAHNIYFSYEKGPTLIRDFSITINPGDRIGIIGRNGKGKSTLLNLLSKKLEPEYGNIKTHPDLNIGCFSSDSKDELHPNASILEELRKVSSSKEQEIRNLCGSLLFSGQDSQKKISVLSGGEKSRVCLGKVILRPTNILFLDEPTNHLDMESCEALTQSLQTFKGTVVFVSHDEDMVSQLANRLVVFDKGDIQVKEKTYQEFLQSEGWSEEEHEEAKFLFTEKVSKNKVEYEERKENKKRLRKIEKELEELHKKIEKNEEEQKRTSTLLQKACMEKNTQEIEDLGKQLKNLHEASEQAFEKMEALLEEEKGLREQLQN